MKYIIPLILFFFPVVASSQTTNLERLFIERVNVLRDSVLSVPLTNMEEYRMVSYNHVNYILKTNHVSHDQRNTRLPSFEDRCKHFAGDDISCGSEILTYNTHILNNDTAIVDTFIKGFMSSKPHRYLLLSNGNRNCTIAIHHSYNKNICVVNFAWAYVDKYSANNWSYFDSTEEDNRLSRTSQERFEAFYKRYYNID